MAFDESLHTHPSDIPETKKTKKQKKVEVKPGFFFIDPSLGCADAFTRHNGHDTHKRGEAGIFSFIISAGTNIWTDFSFQ